MKRVILQKKEILIALFYAVPFNLGCNKLLTVKL